MEDPTPSCGMVCAGTLEGSGFLKAPSHGRGCAYGEKKCAGGKNRLGVDEKAQSCRVAPSNCLVSSRAGVRAGRVSSCYGGKGKARRLRLAGSSIFENTDSDGKSERTTEHGGSNAVTSHVI